MTEWAATLQPFTIKLRDYSTFPGNGVVFIDVEPNAELNALRMGLTKVKDSLPSGTFRVIGPFHPHITIGYRDVPTEVYSQAAAEYQAKSFAGEFEVDEFELWKHNGKRWETLYTYEMKGLPEDLQNRGDELFH
ncbi:MAG: 2'-5' RNA ligase family protein [Bacteroidetes bacterium]|nr:2'-5' RNA ligase family protein [Bacteroidota bacterium]